MVARPMSRRRPAVDDGERPPTRWWRLRGRCDELEGLSGRRVFAFLERGDDRVLTPAIEAVRSGGGTLVLVCTAPMPIGVACGIPYQPALAPAWHSAEDLSREVICQALSRVPEDVPVTTMCAGKSLRTSLARLLCRVHPDLVFVSRRRTAARCRRLADARIALVDRAGRTRLA